MTMHESPYVGSSHADIDLAWQALLADMNIRVTQEELALHSQTFVRLSNGGYLAWLGVYHELHCLVSLCSTPSSHIFVR